MYPSAQLHCAQNADDKLFVPAGYQSSNAAPSLSSPSLAARTLVPLWRGNRVLAFPSLYIRRSTWRRGSAAQAKVASSPLTRRSPSPREKRGSSPLTSALGENNFFHCYPSSLRFLFMRQTMECSFLGARGHADSTSDNKSSAREREREMTRTTTRALRRLLPPPCLLY